MQHEISEAERELKQLCQALRLQYERQDWGIINADPDRLAEFMAYYEANPGLSATQKYELTELILASANAQLSSESGSLPGSLLAFLLRHKHAFETQMDYWRMLTDDAEFPLAKWLRERPL
jgi:hypothetical protein